MNLEQIKCDTETGVHVCRATWTEVLAYAIALQAENIELKRDTTALGQAVFE